LETRPLTPIGLIESRTRPHVCSCACIRMSSAVLDGKESTAWLGVRSMLQMQLFKSVETIRGHFTPAPPRADSRHLKLLRVSKVGLHRSPAILAYDG
jgi:hypothetical protein